MKCLSRPNGHFLNCPLTIDKFILFVLSFDWFQNIFMTHQQEVTFHKHRVFRETPEVTFYDITVEGSQAQDLVIHSGPAISPPDDVVGSKQFYIHFHQIDHNRVVSGERTFELINFDWKYPYHIVHLNVSSGALVIPVGTYHRSTSGEKGSIVINQSIRDADFNVNTEFIPVSAAESPQLYAILKNEKPVIHTI